MAQQMVEFPNNDTTFMRSTSPDSMATVRWLRLCKSCKYFPARVVDALVLFIVRVEVTERSVVESN